VFVSSLAYPDVGDEYLDSVAENPRDIRRQLLHSMIGLYVLEGYDQVGVTLSHIPNEDQPSKTFFVPWGAVIRLQFPGQRPGQRGGTAGD
jgi:hypothetical protein